ncbi:MAG: hypothetical protein ACUVX8_06945, partial [Candidatus Zipacnadales bacterium]
CAGLSREMLTDFGEFLKPYGIEPIASPGSLDEVVETDLVPGAAVSIDLMRGDFEVSMIGTVTYRDGDSVLLFGHPIMQLGAVDIPMSTAFIHDFIPSYDRSDKMGSAMEPVGAARTDGTWSVGGLVGPQAAMVPVDIAVTDETKGQRRTYHVDVAKEKTLTQGLVSMALASAVEAAFRPVGEGTARVKFEVEGEDGAKVRRENIYWNSSSIATACTRDVSTTIYVLQRNPFEPQQPARVSVDVSLSDKNISAAIEEVYTDETVAKAGEKLTVHVVLQPWDGKPFEQVVELDLPEDLQRGTMRIGVCGGEEAYRMRNRLDLLQPEFHDLPSIIEDMENIELNNQLFVAAALPNTGLGVAKYLLHRMPSSIAKIMSTSRTTDIRGGKEEISKLIDTEYVILGQEYLTLATEDKTGARAATPAPSIKQGDASTNEIAAHTESLQHASRINPLTAPPLDWASNHLGQFHPAWRVQGPDLFPAAEQQTSPPPSKSAKPSLNSIVEKESKDQEEETKLEEGRPEKDEGPLTRQLREWRQDKAEDFAEGDAEGLAIRNDGALYVSAKVAAEWQTQKHRSVWSVAGRGGDTVYFGAGRDGHIYQTSPGSEARLLYDTGELAVHALVFSDSMLYAGTIPNGKVLCLDPAKPGEAKVLADLPDDYVWALLPDGAGGVFVGTGNRGRLYHLTASGEQRIVAELPAQHILCLAAFGDDLLAGTAENGILYRVSRDGHYESIYDDEQPAVTGVAVTPSGEVYICTSGEGSIICVTPGRKPLTVATLGKNSATSMTVVGNIVYVGTTDDGRIMAVFSPESYAVAGKTGASEVSCLAAAGTQLLAGAANPGRLIVLDSNARANGTFESVVLDGERTAHWSTLLWIGEVPEGGSAEVQVRSGFTADPDDGTWTPWSEPIPRHHIATLQLPPSRYFQYRVRMAKTEGGSSPIFRSLLLRYAPANRRPEVTIKEPQAGASVSGKFTVKWEGKDEDEDKLEYTLYMRYEGQEEWQLLKDEIEEQEWEWDTTAEGVQEGLVALRLVATDALSSPEDALTKEAIIYPVTIDNTAPRYRQDGEITIAEDRTVSVRYNTWDEASAIASVEYRVGEEGKWKTVSAGDGLFDSRGESFELHTAQLTPGEQKITLRIRDGAGNKTDVQLSVTIPGEKKEESSAAAQPAKTTQATSH